MPSDINEMVEEVEYLQWRRDMIKAMLGNFDNKSEATGQVFSYEDLSRQLGDVEHRLSELSTQLDRELIGDFTEGPRLSHTDPDCNHEPF